MIHFSSSSSSFSLFIYLCNNFALSVQETADEDKQVTHSFIHSIRLQQQQQQQQQNKK